jgi:DNA-binding NtrC family response regulator
VDVRLIAATNADLDRLVKEGRFRQDLYYRLQVVTIHLPPLRERKEDIPLLVQRFLHDLAAENNRPGLQIESEAATALQNYDWPGNVRQLRNTVESMVVLSRGNVIRFPDLPEELKAGGSEEGDLTIPLGTPLKDVERRMILETLRSHGGNRTRTAETLGIGRRTLIRKLQEYELTDRGTDPGKGSD